MFVVFLASDDPRTSWSFHGGHVLRGTQFYLLYEYKSTDTMMTPEELSKYDF